MMKFSYYMHDGKDTYPTFKLMEKLGLVQNHDDIYNHPLYEKIFCTLHQNEIELVFDFDVNGNGTLLEVKAAGKILK